MPSSTPAGTLTESVRSLVTRPEPAHLSHGFSIVCATAVTRGTGALDGEEALLRPTRPWPPQVLHVTGLEPGRAPEPAQASQASDVGMRTVAVLPPNASSSVISRL